MPEGVTTIGWGTFQGCTNLTNVIIPSSITTIWNEAFWRCSSLVSITIPTGATFIGWSAFEETAWLSSQPDGLIYVGKVLYRYKGTMPAKTVINDIREDTVAIADYAFYGCTGLTSITIPSSVTSIGKEAFNGCDNFVLLR